MWSWVSVTIRGLTFMSGNSFSPFLKLLHVIGGDMFRILKGEPGKCEEEI